MWEGWIKNKQKKVRPLFLSPSILKTEDGLYYRKVNHSDKLKTAQVLADPKENLAPPAAKNSNRQMYLLL